MLPAHPWKPPLGALTLPLGSIQPVLSSVPTSIGTAPVLTWCSVLRVFLTACLQCLTQELEVSVGNSPKYFCHWTYYNFYKYYICICILLFGLVDNFLKITSTATQNAQKIHTLTKETIMESLSENDCCQLCKDAFFKEVVILELSGGEQVHPNRASFPMAICWCFFYFFFRLWALCELGIIYSAI